MVVNVVSAVLPAPEVTPRCIVSWGWSVYVMLVPFILPVVPIKSSMLGLWVPPGTFSCTTLSLALLYLQSVLSHSLLWLLEVIDHGLLTIGLAFIEEQGYSWLTSTLHLILCCCVLRACFLHIVAVRCSSYGW